LDVASIVVIDDQTFYTFLFKAQVFLAPLKPQLIVTDCGPCWFCVNISSCCPALPSSVPSVHYSVKRASVPISVQHNASSPLTSFVHSTSSVVGTKRHWVA